MFGFINSLVTQSYVAIRNTAGPAYFEDIGQEVTQDIFIGSLLTAKDRKWLVDNGINYIINMSGSEYSAPVPVFDLSIEDKYINDKDLKLYVDVFKKGTVTIREALRKGCRILIHCAAGINRSATLIAFYLMENGKSYEEAIQLLEAANKKRKVPVITNGSFRLLLNTKQFYKLTVS